VRRRDFIKIVACSAASWPVTAAAQRPSRPVIGFLGSASPSSYAIRLDAFRQGLGELGFVEGQNVTVEYRWAEGVNTRLPALAAELVQRQVTVLVAGGGTPSALAAKAATTVIPIVFEVATDPVVIGLVASLNRPGGNVTGIANLNVETAPKRLELLRKLLPAATNVAVLVNPSNQILSKAFLKALHPAANTLGFQLHVLEASTEPDIDKAFAAISQIEAASLIIMPDVFFSARGEELGRLTVTHAVPAIYAYRAFVSAGGLLSYGADEADNYRMVGNYAGKILKGEKPAELPVQQPTKVQLMINLKTANALGITVPAELSGRADELIE
jgi:putative tryptophan/tyrosine transport system substrate-binding protein